MLKLPEQEHRYFLSNTQPLFFRTSGRFIFRRSCNPQNLKLFIGFAGYKCSATTRQSKPAIKPRNVGNLGEQDIRRRHQGIQEGKSKSAKKRNQSARLFPRSSGVIRISEAAVQGIKQQKADASVTLPRIDLFCGASLWSGALG